MMSLSLTVFTGPLYWTREQNGKGARNATRHKIINADLNSNLIAE